MSHRPLIVLFIICLVVTGCSDETNPEDGISDSATATVTTPAPKWAATPTATANVTATKTSTPISSPTPTPPYILPSVTMSPEEVEQALRELLRTNGGCKGKCIAGIYPDEMSIQEMVDQMAHWGNLVDGINLEGGAYVAIDQNQLADEVNLYLGMHSREVTLSFIDQLSFRIDTSNNYSGSNISGEMWQANRKNWQAFQFDGLLKGYGMPTFVGFYFRSIAESWTDLNGRSVEYDLSVFYKQYNLEILLDGVAYYDGEEFGICPSIDPHNLAIIINPSMTVEKRNEFYPLTWQGLTGTDLTAFYQKFTDETNPDACFTTTVEKILELDPYFR